MPEDKKTKEQIHKEKVEDFKKKVQKKEGTDKKEFIAQIATRSILERDYKEDTIEVIFNSSPSTRRKLIAHKPTPRQINDIVKFSMDANEATAINGFAKLAEELTTDKTLNKEFWLNKVSTNTLISFINELMNISMKGPLSESELDKFR